MVKYVIRNLSTTNGWIQNLSDRKLASEIMKLML